jgi:hypothetical protein
MKSMKPSTPESRPDATAPAWLTLDWASLIAALALAALVRANLLPGVPW